MKQTIKPAMSLQVIDLVLDPFTYRDALIAPVREGLLESEVVAHLARVLPLAIAQLDAVGDTYGALALDGLYDQLEQLPAVV